MVKKLPAMWETWVQSLDWEDLLERGIATHLTILAWRIPWTGRQAVHVVSKRQTERLSLSQTKKKDKLTVNMGYCFEAMCLCVCVHA